MPKRQSDNTKAAEKTEPTAPAVSDSGARANQLKSVIVDSKNRPGKVWLGDNSQGISLDHSGYELAYESPIEEASTCDEPRTVGLPAAFGQPATAIRMFQDPGCHWTRDQAHATDFLVTTTYSREEFYARRIALHYFIDKFWDADCDRCETIRDPND